MNVTRPLRLALLANAAFSTLCALLMIFQSEILGGKAPGVGAVRRCINRAGQSWEEECIAFEPGSSFVLRFATEAANFPFPATIMLGGWQVAPAGNGSEVTVWWELAPKPRFLAPILLPMLAFQADRDFTRIIARMARDASGLPSPNRHNANAAMARQIPRWC